MGEVVVSGKTGTLTGEAPPGLYQWFIGVAPADDPRIAIACFVIGLPMLWLTIRNLCLHQNSLYFLS